MVIVLLEFIYIFAISFLLGVSVNRALSFIIPVPGEKRLGITGFVVTGLVTLTVYAEVFSLFGGIGALCHVIMLALTAVGTYLCRKEISKILSGILKSETGKRFAGITSFLKTKAGIICVLVVLGAAFFTSRGTYHTDTGIYHAQAIRVLEEYGVIKGLGNFQLHFAYNSSYLALCALFTLGFILPVSLHVVTGFFMALFTCRAVMRLSSFMERDRHVGDMAFVAVILYALTNMTGLQSPATDYGTMFLTLYILAEFIAFAEACGVEKTGAIEQIGFYGYLSVLSIFTVSMKLSAAALVLLTVLPFIMLVKEKMWKEMGTFILVGFLSFLPFLIRNVIISGWLFYPVESIDLFNVIWKVPADYMLHDAAQIKVWGRCIYDVSRVKDPVSSWIGAWWGEKQHYEQMLIYSQFVGGVVLVVASVRGLLKKSFSPARIVFYLTVFVNIAMWFFTAPFIRYGLAFLLILPLCAAGELLEKDNKKSLGVWLALGLIAVNFFSWVDNYFMSDLVFVKHNLTQPYYIMQVPFEYEEMETYDMNGETVYYSGAGIVNSYYVCPGSCYKNMVERTELIGDTIKEGFKAKAR
ncbi:MAG: hypothetical protein K6G10_11290 [Butyrivibrio sp.]|nr:hypothetical protein [Butyrivibrio sp.]